MKMAQCRRKYGETGSFSLPTKQTSMCSLIIWNISKALEKNPCLDLRHAMRSAHERLARASRDENEVISQPEERHLSCAVLAWQQLGHKDTDSLYQFIEQNRNKSSLPTYESSNKDNVDSVSKATDCSLSHKDLCHKSSTCSKAIDSFNFDTKSFMGPVVKLPVETKIIMRLDNTACSRHSGKKPPKSQKDSEKNIINKIDAACCMDSVCVQRLAELDTAVCELRTRAARLARREAERVELLERAEAAWKDLELGYQRRLNLAEEKEDDIAKQIKKTIEERNSYKGACTNMVEKLKERGGVAEKERARLTQVEKELCDRACVRLRLSEEAARGDAALAEQGCRATQLDRDLQFKEDQVRRKASFLESEIQSARCLTQEAECAMRAELGALKDQIMQVSNQLLAEESESSHIKIQLEELRKEKEALMEDLDGCRTTCDNRMQGKIQELKQKREELMQLKEKVIECRCKIPQDVGVEVKRTPSLAALCQCTPEDKLLDSCSCTSLRTQLLSNLLGDLFGGLQSELGGSGSLMPCQLLKCLEDKHNWDRASVVKTNLRNFFEQLLVGELDIAIATSIEKYHAKWIGVSCADQVQMLADPEDVNEGWQERAIERRAQTLATKLAEQLFKERAEQITNKAKEIVTKGPPPCECKTQPAVYQCLVKRPTTTYSARKNTETAPLYLKRTLQDVSQLRVQVEDLKKEAIKKEDLRHLEEKIARIVKRAPRLESITSANKKNKRINETDEKMKENTKTFQENDKNAGTLDISERKTLNNTKHRINDSCNNLSGHVEKKTGKLYKKIEQSFAVNLCLCEEQNNLPEKSTYNEEFQISMKQKKSNNKISAVPSYKQLKIAPGENADNKGVQNSTKCHCPSKCVCFHKIPSNTSIEKLLETLLKWKGDVNNVRNNSILYNEGKGSPTSNGFVSGDNINDNKSTIYSIVNGIDNNLFKNSVTEGHDKSTDYDILPTTTDSEYIGAVNLDKSNDGSCKFTNHNYKSKYGDGNDISYHKKSSELNRDHKENYSSNGNIGFNEKQSQVYSMKLYGSKFKCADSKLENMDNSASKHSLEISGVPYVDDVLKKSKLLSCDCDYSVKFLGVTLTKPKSIRTSKQIDESHIISSSTNLCTQNIKDNPSDFELKNAHLSKQNKTITSELQCESNDYKYGMVVDVISDTNEKSKTLKNISEKKENEETKCVCCDKEEDKDLELNAFNLLEEHLKGKLVEFQRSSCTSKCISTEEEKKLFSKILKKVKEVLSENTTHLSCKCIGFNVKEESWKRAYGLLQEYLKIKMKRVQCSCISHNESVGTLLPAILDKINNLIENDFQRLKNKCKCENKNIANYPFKNRREQETETILKNNDIFVQFDNSENSNQQVKNIQNTSTQLLSIPLDNKSCEVMYSELKSINTAEKKVSCEIKKGYITDCSCLYAINESCYLDLNVTSNQCAKSILSKNTKMKSNNTFKAMDLSTPVKDIRELDKDMSLVNLKQETKPIFSCPYRGYPLKCSCDGTVGSCHCTKSLVETSCDKKYLRWNLLDMEENPKNQSCMTCNFPRKIKSEYVQISKGTDCMKPTLSEKKCYDVEVIAANKEEEIALKHSNDACCKPNISLSISTESNEVGPSHSHACNVQETNNIEDYETNAEINKNMLLNSLYLPTNQFSEYSKFGHKDSNINYTESEICECKMVPLCHVKMLVENIEHKLVHSQCTCDSFCSQVCPIHAKEEFS